MVWFTSEDCSRIRRQLADGHPHATGLLAYARAIADGPVADRQVQDPERPDERVLVDGAEYLSAITVCFAATGEQAYADRAYEVWTWWIEGWTPSDLGLAMRTIIGVAIWDVCGSAWSDHRRATWCAWLHRCIEGQRIVRRGNPHQVGNNWWAITHSAVSVAALAIDGQAGPDGLVYDLGELRDWANGRLHAFAKHFGDAGLYHEGLGYQGYTISHLFPAMVAATEAGHCDFFTAYPQLRSMLPSLFITACERPGFSDNDAVPRFAAQLSWNDAGQSYGGSGATLLMLQMAPADLQPGLLDYFDRIHGHRSPDPDWAEGYGGLVFSFLRYPYELVSAPAAELLPHHRSDSRQGLVFSRNAYVGADDALLGCYAKSTHVGGHAHRDAGSVRFMALGHDWVIGGGQARGEAEWQSVVTPAGGLPAGSRQQGLIIWDEAAARGPIVGMDLRRVSAAYHERYVAAHWRLPQQRIGLAMLDQIDDHEQRDWCWHLSHAPGLSVSLAEEGCGFTLKAEDGTAMTWRFLGVNQSERIDILEMPGSSRTFSGGSTSRYAGRPFLKLHFTAARPLAIFAVGVVHRGPAPSLALGEGLDLLIDGESWERPFGAAIPADFTPGVHAGLCPHPTGRPDYELPPLS